MNTFSTLNHTQNLTPLNSTKLLSTRGHPLEASEQNDNESDDAQEAQDNVNENTNGVRQIACAEKIATGHYARCGKRSDVHTLLRSPDPGKDQSYFLYRMTQDDLAHAVFPVGGMYKREVRALAQEFDLPVSKKHDSQGLCFVGDVSIPEFLSRYIDLKRGPVVDTAGREIGEHDGVALYTVGQRHGFRTTTNTPHYVVSGDIGSNTLVVSAEKADTLSRSATLSDVHWIGETPGEGETLEAQTRYHAAIARATLAREGADWQVAFDKPELLSPGQSVVLYRGDECVGGGVVEKTTRN
jgi:tRNA-specific 2-thiouridylase